MEKFYFEEPSISRKEDALSYINEFYEYNSEINGVGGLHRYLDNYEDWLKKLEEDFYKIKFILKTGELINENLPNGKLDIGTNFGKYGFTTTKELGEKEDNVSAYVLQRHPNIESCSFLYIIIHQIIISLF